MANPWVKLHVSLIDNEVFLRMSPAARLTFIISIALAGKQDKDGALALRVGPMTVEEIAQKTGLTVKRQQIALDSLTHVGFLSRRLDQAYVVERWREKAGDLSSERVRRHRAKMKIINPETSSGCVSETFPERFGNGRELELELDKDKELELQQLVSSCGLDGVETQVIPLLKVQLAKNKNPKVTPLSLCEELSKVLHRDLNGSIDAFQYGLSEAMRIDADNKLAYVKSVGQAQIKRLKQNGIPPSSASNPSRYPDLSGIAV